MSTLHRPSLPERLRPLSPLLALALSACMAGPDDGDIAGGGGQLSEACDQEPLTLTPIDVSPTDDEADGFRADCSSGGAWCSLSALRGFALPECPAEPVTLEAVFELVRQLDQEHSGLEFDFGQVLDRAGASATSFFGTAYSDGGPALLESIDAIAAGAPAAPIEAWSVSQQVPCHNCTDFQDTIILLYRDTGTVFLLDGGHGYDS